MNELMTNIDGLTGFLWGLFTGVIVTILVVALLRLFDKFFFNPFKNPNQPLYYGKPRRPRANR